MNDTWTDLRQARPPAELDWALVWHEFQGVMLVRIPGHTEGRARRARAWRQALDNRFFRAWKRVPADGWIDAGERLPTKADTDEYNCVLAWDEFDGPKVTGWHQFRESGHLVRWMRIEDRREYHGGSERA